jgi:hypothetical protein
MQRLSSRVAAFGSLLLAALFASARANAQPAPASPPAGAQPDGRPPPDQSRNLPPGESERSGSRTLNANTFQRPVFLDSAFVGGYFGDGTRIGFATETFGPKQQYNIAAIFENLSFGIPIGKRLQFAFDGNYNALFGTDTTSLFAFGGSFGFDLDPGLRFMILRSDSTGSVLSLHGSAIIAYSPGVSPANLITILGQDLTGITSNQHRLQCLLKLKFQCAFPGIKNILAAIETSSTSFGGEFTINYAQALGRYAGLQATGGVKAEDSSFSAYFGTKQSSSSSVPFTVEGGIGPSLNFYPQVPLGIQFEYLAQFATEASGGNATNSLTHNLAAGFYYTGRRDLQLGLSGTVTIENQTTTATSGASATATLNYYTGAFGLYYYF